MPIRNLLVIVLVLAMPAFGAAEELILPVFALNAPNPDGSRWSTEIYLVNPTPEPVSVAIAGLLPGRVSRPTPCGQFMSPTRVVPPQSAVLWTASGLATDLGCADEVLGALTLHADGPVRVTARLVRHFDTGEATPLGVLSGNGQSSAAIRVTELPGPTTLLLPALLWHRNPCGEPSFTTDVGFANPGAEPVTVTLYLPKESRGAVRINHRTVSLPYQFVVEADRWTQIRVEPLPRPFEGCFEPESFDLEVVIDGPLAVYGSVLDSRSMDSRTVAPVDLQRH
jgi:hypothetical protein